MISDIHVENAEASVEQDKEMILALVCGSPPTCCCDCLRLFQVEQEMGCPQVNKYIVAVLRGWLLRTGVFALLSPVHES